MGVFDKIKSGASSIGQDISTFAKTSTETMQLKNDLGKLDVQMREGFEAIGRQYFEEHKDDAAAEFRDAVENINAIEKQKAEITNQLNEIRGIRICPNCGGEVQKDARFCVSCGTKMPEPEPKIVKPGVCPKCGAQALPEALFCNVCGTRLPESAPAPAEEVLKASVCPNCGAEITKDMSFCISCGAKLFQSEQAAAGDDPVILDEASEEETPAQEASEEETPAQEAPEEETPAQEAPGEETPA